MCNRIIINVLHLTSRKHAISWHGACYPTRGARVCAEAWVRGMAEQSAK